MIINHNIAAMNTSRQLGVNNTSASKSLEKLSSGFRINRAGDDAAGLSISEKMRGQIRGLDQASRNSQDAISMLQTAEGNLNETENILQRMKELATQAANGTLANKDQEAIQSEMNHLTSEINKIGNTTEFNTQKLLQGDGKANLTATGTVLNQSLTGGSTTTTEASQTITLATGTGGTAGQKLGITLNGQTITASLLGNTNPAANNAVTNLTQTTADVNLNATTNDEKTTATALATALQAIVDGNASLKGNWTVKADTTGKITVQATKGGLAAGNAGNIAASSGNVAVATAGAISIGVTTTTASKAADVANFTGVNNAATAKALVGTGLTIDGQQIEFYNANDGAYKGNAIGVNLSDVINSTGTINGTSIVNAIKNQAGPQMKNVDLSEGTSGKLTVTAKVGGEAGDNIRVTDGGVQKQFQAIFQIGANQGQSMTININDMRSAALGIAGKTGAADTATGAVFTAGNVVNNGTDDVVVEAALDITGHKNATNAIKTLDNAIERVSAERSKLGAFTNRLEHTVNNLGTSSENMSAAESRIRDVDMAKEMMAYSKEGILSQAATAMLAKANQQPEGVLQLLR